MIALMDAEFFNAILVQAIGSLLGVFVGALAALATDRYNNRRRKQQRAKSLLRVLTQEMSENHETMRAVKSAYQNTAWGKSFYVSTIAWETALASDDLPEILGYELADQLAEQYGLLVRIRYYVDLLTRLWLAPQDIAGYQEIQRGFRQAIVTAMEKAIYGHAALLQRIRQD